MLNSAALTAPAERTYRYRWVIGGVFWTTYVVIYMQRLGIGPLGPFLKEDMGLTGTQLGSLMSAASLGYMLSILPAGWLSDRIPIRYLLLIGEALGGVFMIVMFFTPSYTAALVIMVMSGLGSGFLMPSSARGIILWFPVKERATMMGIKQTGVNVGGIVTGAMLPGIALAVGWRYGFLLVGIIAVAIGILSFVLYHDPPAAPRTVASPQKPAETARRKQLSELLKARDIWMVGLGSFLFAVVEFGLIAHLVLYLSEEVLLPVVTAGVLLAIAQAGGIFGKPGSGILSDRWFHSSRVKVFVLFSGISMVTSLVVMQWGGALGWGLYPVLFLMGLAAIGWGGIQLTLTAELAGKELVGTASGIGAMCVNGGAVLGPLLWGYLADFSGSYRLAWLSAAIFSGLATVAVLFVRENRRRI